VQSIIIPNLSISFAPRRPLTCATDLESEICDPVAGLLRSRLKLEKSAMATGTFVTVQLPIAMLFTLLVPKRSQVRPNNPPTFESVLSTVRPNVFTLLASMTVLGDPVSIIRAARRLLMETGTNRRLPTRRSSFAPPRPCFARKPASVPLDCCACACDRPSSASKRIARNSFFMR
jgi:hypothetical protein